MGGVSNTELFKSFLFKSGAPHGGSSWHALALPACTALDQDGSTNTEAIAGKHLHIFGLKEKDLERESEVT